MLCGYGRAAGGSGGWRDRPKAAGSAVPRAFRTRASSLSGAYVEARTWHPSQRVERFADGRARLTLDVSIDWALTSWLLGFGADVKVIAPPKLAASLRDTLTSAAKQYL